MNEVLARILLNVYPSGSVWGPWSHGPQLYSHGEESLTHIRSKCSSGCSPSPAHAAWTVSQMGVVVVGMNKRQVNANPSFILCLPNVATLRGPLIS